ncbi:TadE/TadG family type IV pilus assembly protein [Myceligenerans crystallogenes]|uniref:TadE-like domain-containing protein n=1 Tax=Myceligenerans crystallogenes TaxID=316335 RepID=A0ABN2NLA1_9MICO
MTPRRPAVDDEGSASVEVVVLAPAFALLLGLVLLAGRVILATQAVETAAWDAARTASLTESEGVASRAEEVAMASLRNQDLDCAGSDVAVDTSHLAGEPGTPSSITVTVSCTVPLWDLPFDRWTHRVEARATAPTDQWKSEP